MEWVSLVGSTFFDGIHADVLVVAGGIIGIGLVICGVGLLIGTMSR